MSPRQRPKRFILANTALMAPPHVPEIALHLADEAHDLWLRTEDELAEIGLPPPFWAFAWAGGQGLARYILDNPETVRGKRVLDFATGSGLVAIAAAKAGAASVTAADIDPSAAAAIGLNAVANAVEIAIDKRDPIGKVASWTWCSPATSSTTAVRRPRCPVVFRAREGQHAVLSAIPAAPICRRPD